MRYHLLIDTADDRPAVALLREQKPDNLRISRVATFEGEHCAEQLIAQIASLIEHQPLSLAVVTGPGKWTGLRVGATAGKVLSWWWQIPLYGLNAPSSMTNNQAVDNCLRHEALAVSLAKRLKSRRADDPYTLEPDYQQAPHITVARKHNIHLREETWK